MVSGLLLGWVRLCVCRNGPAVPLLVSAVGE